MRELNTLQNLVTFLYNSLFSNRMNHSCRCSCGNISIAGRVLSAHEVPQQLQNGTIMVGSAKCGAFAIKPQAIDVKSRDNTNIYVSSNNVCTITCRNCGQSIQFIDNEKFGYAVFHKVSKNGRRQSTPLDYNDVKPSLTQYIKFEDENNTEPLFMGDETLPESSEPFDDENEVDFVDEGDFEYMFSGKTDPFIGSFQDHFISQPTRAILI